MHQGSSSGSSDDSCKLQLKAYAKVDTKPPERHRNCIPVMVSITAPSGIAEQHAPVDLVVVLHVCNRCNVPENWQELLMEAMKVVVEKLGDEDRLALVPVQSTLRLMSAQSWKVASVNVRWQEISNYTSMVEYLELADSTLHGRGYKDKEKRAGYIIVISNCRADMYCKTDMGSLLTWRFRSVHAFGFRDAHNARTMHSIASSRECTYAILDDEHGRITQAFAASIDKITSAVAAVPMEVKLKCDQKVVLSAIDAPRISYFISHDKKVGTIWANVHQAGVATNFIVYVDLRGHKHDDLPELFTVHAMYGHASDKLDEQVVTDTVRKGIDGSKEVAAEIVRIDAVKIVAEDKNYWQQLYAAADYLRERWSRLENSDYGREACEAGLISGLATEMQEMEIRLHNNYLWLEYMLSWQSHQRWQLPLPPLFIDTLLRLSILAKVDAIPGTPAEYQQRLPVLVRVVASMAGLAKTKRLPVDLIAVLDVSSASSGPNVTMEEKRNLLNMAMELVMEKLCPKDRLAIIPVVQASVTEPAAGLLEMSKQGRSETSGMLQRLVVGKLPTASANNKAAQTSHWREQLKKAMKLVRKCLHIGPESQSIAVGGSTKLWKALTDAVKILDDRRDEEKDRVGFIILISDSDDDSILQETLSPNYIIHAFGFRDAHNTRAMHHIASSSNGIYAILNDDRNKISEAFKACINKITSTVAVHTKVDIMCSHSSSVMLSTIESGRFSSGIYDDKKSGFILAGALYAGAVRNFIVYMDNVREDDYDNLSKLFTVDVKWLHVVSRFRRVEEKLDGQVIVVRNGTDGSKEVVADIIRVEVAKIVSEITDPNCDTNLVANKLHELNMRLKGFENARADGKARLASLMSQMRRMEANMRLPSKLPYMLSWLSFQGLSEQPLFLLEELPLPKTKPVYRPERAT